MGRRKLFKTIRVAFICLALISGEVHNFSTLSDTATQLKAEFATLLRECGQKLTEMCKVEKQTWQELDEMNQSCDELTEEVNKKAEELVSIKPYLVHLRS